MAPMVARYSPRLMMGNTPMAKNGMTAHEYRRLREKLHRLAYELEYDAARLRASCPAYASRADAVRAIASRLGDIARGDA